MESLEIIDQGMPSLILNMILICKYLKVFMLIIRLHDCFCYCEESSYVQDLPEPKDLISAGTLPAEHLLHLINYMYFYICLFIFILIGLIYQST